MPPNTNPIVTDTKVRKVPIGNEMEKTIREQSDQMGAAGYQLASSFVLDQQVILIYQLTR